MKKTIAILLVLAMVLSMIPLIGASAAVADRYIVGDFNGWSAGNASYKMTYDETLGVFKYTFSSVTKDIQITFKFTGANGWGDNEYPSNGGNIYYTPVADGNLTIAYNPTTNEVSYYGTAVPYYLRGGMNEWGKTPMTLEEDIYKATATLAENTYYEFKVDDKDDWGDLSWPSPSSNANDTTTEAGEYTFTFNPITKAIAMVAPGNQGGSVTPPPATGPVYIIAGVAGLCGSEWNPNDTNNQLTDPDGDGTYSVTFTGIAKGDYEFKLVTDGQWAPDPNSKITVAADNTDVTISYNGSELTLAGATWYVPPVELDLTPGVYVVGNGSGNWINGKEWGNTWDADGDVNKMTADGKKFNITYADVAAGSFEFKFVIGKSWNDNFTMEWISGNAIVPGETVNAKYNNNHNTTFTTSALSDIALELDLTNYNHTSKEGATMKVTVTPVVYTFTVTPEGGTEGAKTAFDGNSATLDNQAVGSYTVKLYRNDVLADTKTVEVESANSSIVISHAASVLSASAQAHTYSVSDGTSTKDLVLGADNKYSFTFEGVAAGTYTYTVKEDGTVTIGSVNVTVDEDDSKVTIVYTPNSATPVTSSVKAPDPVHYYVAGTENLCGNAWSQNDANNELTKGSDGKYSKTYTGLQPGKKYEFKITNGAWPPSGQEWSDNGSNYEFAVSEASDVTIVFDPATGSVDILGDKVTEYQPPVDIDYYVVGIGSIFGDKTWADAATVAGNKMEKQADGSYKKVYTVTTAGTIELKVHSPADNGWYGDGSNNFVINATEGMTITVTFANGAASVETAGGTQGGGTTPPPATEDTYHLVGFGSVFSAEWSTDGGFLLTKGSDGKYTKVFENVAAGELGFKVVKNNTVWIPDGMGNETKVTAKQGATVTVVFDPADNSITATAVGGTDSDDDDDDQGGGTVTPPASTYYVAGNADLTGASWDENDPNNLMTAAGSKFSKTYTGLQPGKKYEFKITDGTWTNSWGIGDNKSDNYVFAVSAESSVTITFDPATKEITVTGDKLTAYVPEVTSATVVGSKGLCGGAADWATESDGAMVKGTDGKFVKVFSNVAAGNYECKVLTNNGDWYPGSNVSVAVSANGSTVTVTFDPAAGTVTASVKAPEGGDQGDNDDDQGGTVTPPPATNDVYHVVGSGSIFAADWTIADADKMEKQSDGTYKKVYTGVAKGNLGIKVVKNNTTWIPDGFDNEIKAEVTADNSTVTVTYNPTTGKVDVKINGKAAGSATGTPEGGNTGDSGNAGTTVKEITIYAKVPSHWTAPKAWAWKGSQNVATTGWPGELNMVKGENGWWSIKITSNIEGVLICNVVGTAVEQTADVKVTTAGANIYVTVGEKQADGKYATTATFESVPSNGDETNLFGMVVVTMAAVLGMGITVLSKKKFF